MKARDIAAKIHSGETTSVEVTGYFLERIEKLNPEINAFIKCDRDYALKQASGIDKQIQAGEIISPLAGVPIALKDNIMTEGLSTTCGSKILANHTAVYDATVVSKLKKSGLIIIGKTNMDEFGMGSSNEYSHFGAVKNPLGTSRVPGGSSGGSAAAVASGMTPLALGTDTGGSVRQPGSFCGLAGFRPTYGLVSRYGLVAFASSFDQIGPFAKDITDLSLILSIIAGHDKRDSTSIDQTAQDYAQDLDQGLDSLKIGIPKEYFDGGMDKAVRQSIEMVLEKLAKSKNEIIEISLPSAGYSLAVYYIIANAEASSNLARYDGVLYCHRSSESETLMDMYLNTRTEGFGPEVKRRILLGTYVLSAGYYDAYYRRALQARKTIANDFSRAFEQCDLILSPTSPSTAFGLGERLDDPLQMYLSDIYTVTAPLANIPAVSVPCGSDDVGLPVGLQLMGRYLGEKTILSGAYHIERLIANG
ncbi:MAG: Asp-tRNA(Asn)/Glu-tRNA(Gln) amidotransferase subunit GatA [candidate division Zixibacteria bacterium]|nr:Asp-tRNA(Asn)/Glu-tRNA(Gln) amidotransferase subunit GatA [candidate division Zixibacteria bacterium]